jgi:hypothetical protein
MTWVRAQLCKLQKGCTRLATASNNVYQLLAQDRWFSQGTPASSTTKIGRHDIAEILLKVALNTKIQIHSIQYENKYIVTVKIIIADIYIKKQKPLADFGYPAEAL